mgnify:CR=1 FL=1
MYYRHPPSCMQERNIVLGKYRYVPYEEVSQRELRDFEKEKSVTLDSYQAQKYREVPDDSLDQNDRYEYGYLEVSIYLEFRE